MKEKVRLVRHKVEKEVFLEHAYRREFRVVKYISALSDRDTVECFKNVKNCIDIGCKNCEVDNCGEHYKNKENKFRFYSSYNNITVKKEIDGNIWTREIEIKSADINDWEIVEYELVELEKNKDKLNVPDEYVEEKKEIKNANN